MLSMTRHNDLLEIRTPAKINVGLRVLGKRADGYHEIESLVVAIDLADTLEVRPAEDDRLTLSVFPETSKVPADDSNLVLRAARLLRQEAGIAAGAYITLHKKIPAGRGLGGGSSDAAAALVVLNELWQIGLDRTRLVELASRLGSDVPFFLRGPVCLMRGRGEVLEPVDCRLTTGVLLVVPPFPLATVDVYGRWGGGLTTARNGARLWLSLLRDGKLSDLGRTLVNDLEAPALSLRSELRQYREALLNAGGSCVSMTGSGSAWFALLPSCEEARQVAQRLHLEADAEVHIVAPWNSVASSANSGKGQPWT
ncbi:MAG TPA: 4-(cytidine 5'-diphospho)-2-C-methyl-D-erythritol kinase [Phycisphaerae bacterium]|nr:4-(cytidine 5'-diphospho)-2-C-methyl-D-erythritol kinase [Phycisphaerae bacterium]